LSLRVRSVGKRKTKPSEEPDAERLADDPRAITGAGEQGSGKPAVEPFFLNKVVSLKGVGVCPRSRPIRLQLRGSRLQAVAG